MARIAAFHPDVVFVVDCVSGFARRGVTSLREFPVPLDGVIAAPRQLVADGGFPPCRPRNVATRGPPMGMPSALGEPGGGGGGDRAADPTIEVSDDARDFLSLFGLVVGGVERCRRLGPASQAWS